MKLKRWIIALFCMAAPAALACGVCLEDKVASAYDHAVVQRALAKGRIVVFCELSGARAAPILAGEAKRALHGLRGVDPASVRISRELAVVSFALDPAAQDPATAVDALRQKLQPKGTDAALLKVMGRNSWE